MSKMNRYIVSLLIAFIVTAGVASFAQGAATITVVNLDGPGEGFNDPTAPDPDSTSGGNTGITLGEQRLQAFQHAADLWGAELESSVEIRVGARFDPLTCSAGGAVLGSAGANSAIRDFAGAPHAGTYYVMALANKLSGVDLDPALDDIGATFNSAIGTTCPFTRVWYYGLDGSPPVNTIDFVTVVLHELAHGLGFLTYVDLATGAKPNGYDDAYMLHLEDHSAGKMYPAMTNAERVAASTNTGNLHWTGPFVLADSFELTTGKAIPSGHVLMYAPDPAESGSSVSHWDKVLTPDEQEEPSYTGADHTVGLSKSLLCDIGWCSGEPVDLFILVDLSSSFNDDIENFRKDASELIDTLADQFDLKVGLGSFVDYPISPFGSSDYGDYAYKREIDLTSDIAAVTSFIENSDNLQRHWGDDGPESQLAALYQAATGAGQTVAGYPGAGIPVGKNAHFRDGVVKLFLLWTDAGFHLPGDPGEISYPGPSFDATVNAILALDPPQVLSVVSGHDSSDAMIDAMAMAEATNAFAPEGGIDCDDDGIIDIPEGEPIVCTTDATGVGIGKAIEKVVTAAVEAGTPVAKCKDVTVPADSDSCSAVVSIDDGSFDPDEGTLTLTQFPAGPYSVGETIVTLKVADESGRYDFCKATVTVEDITPPVVVTQNITVQLDADGNASISVDDIDKGSTDNCCLGSKELSKSSFTYFDIGENTVTLTITDCNGNSSSAPATVTVTPYTVPVSTTGLITDKPESDYRDVALFTMTGVTDIETVAMEAAAAGTALTFTFGADDEEAIYSFTADSFDAAGNRMIYSDADGNMVRCVFSTETCVVRLRYVDVDGNALDTLLPGDMTVSLQIGYTSYSNAGAWTRTASGSGTWTKYRKDN